MSVQQPNGAAATFRYTYDAASRLTNLASIAGSFGYEYQTTDASNGKGSLIRKLTMPNSSYVTNSFNNMGQLLSTYLKNSSHSVLNAHSYSNNVGGQRVKQTRTGGDYLDYTYDDIGQLKTAFGKESGGTARLHEKFGYAYDASGNLQYRTNNALIQTFAVDSLNQISSVGRSGTLTVAGNSTAAASLSVNGSSATVYGDNSFVKDGLTVTNGANSFTAIGTDAFSRSATNTAAGSFPSTVSMAYDSNGNLTSDGYRGHTYDDENQLISIVATNEWKSEFTYDGNQRRRIRTDYIWRSSVWVSTNETRYIYDGNVMVQERDANNYPRVTYTRGLDLSGGLNGAGGIGGLLARPDPISFEPNSFRYQPQTAYYHQDGNGNVTYLADRNQQLAAKYTYDPYGNVLARSGPLAEVSRMQFSGKESDQASGLSYYGRRFYNPALQRWVNQDPIGFDGDHNFYRFILNSPISTTDAQGLWSQIARPIWITPDPVDKRAINVSIFVYLNIYWEDCNCGDDWLGGFDHQLSWMIEALSKWQIRSTYGGVKGLGKVNYKFNLIPNVYFQSRGDEDPTGDGMSSAWNTIKVEKKNNQTWWRENGFIGLTDALGFVDSVGGSLLVLFPGFPPGSPTTPWTLAHEIGHLLGHDDKYDLVTRKPISKEWAGNLMAGSGQGGALNWRNIHEILRFHDYGDLVDNMTRFISLPTGGPPTLPTPVHPRPPPPQTRR